MIIEGCVRAASAPLEKCKKKRHGQYVCISLSGNELVHTDRACVFQRSVLAISLCFGIYAVRVNCLTCVDQHRLVSEYRLHRRSIHDLLPSVIKYTRQILDFTECFYFAECFIFYTRRMYYLPSARWNVLGKPLDSRQM